MTNTGAVLAWLLDSDPSIRWQVMRDLLDAPEAEWAAERAKVETEGWGARLPAPEEAGGRGGGGGGVAVHQRRHGRQRHPLRRRHVSRGGAAGGGAPGGRRLELRGHERIG